MTSPSSESVIRPARLTDLPQVERFIARFVDEKRILPRTADELDLLIPTGFIAELDGRIVGFTALEIYSRKLAEIRSLCVDPAAQGRGIGKQLVDACLALGRKLHVFEVMVITSEEEFFRSRGFDFTLPGEKKALFQQLRPDH
jgi:amino-acid N-acetyltransferase